MARAAGVSQSTVSYVLNDTEAARRITDATKQRVWTAVEQLGYKFNPIGRALQRGYSNQVTLLIVTWDLATSHAATAMAISRAAAQRELSVTVHVVDDDKTAEAYVRRSALHSLGGILVLWDSPAFDESSIRRLAGEGLPVIDLLPGGAPGISVVTADREDAGFRASGHLIELGHREIGFIGDVEARPHTTTRKLAGFRRAWENAGMAWDGSLVQNVTEYGFEGGQIGFRKLIARRPNLTGLFCINDAIALGAIDAAGEMGLKCPERISVVGFGDSPEGRHWRPKLTTFALSSNRVATEAIELIVAQRRSERTGPASILIPEDLILRESTAQRPA